MTIAIFRKILPYCFQSEQFRSFSIVREYVNATREIVVDKWKDRFLFRHSRFTVVSNEIIAREIKKINEPYGLESF